MNTSNRKPPVRTRRSTAAAETAAAAADTPLFDPVERSVRFYTDCRSPKVRHMAGEPRVALLFYDPVARLRKRIDELCFAVCIST